MDLLRCTVDSQAQEVVVKALDDCKALTQLGDKILESQTKRVRHNRSVKALQVLLWLFLMALLMVACYWFLLHTLKTDPLLVCFAETGRWIYLKRAATGDSLSAVSSRLRLVLNLLPCACTLNLLPMYCCRWLVYACGSETG